MNILALDLGKFNTMCCFFDTGENKGVRGKTKVGENKGVRSLWENKGVRSLCSSHDWRHQ
jgi:hypothetical protein